MTEAYFRFDTSAGRFQRLDTQLEPGIDIADFSIVFDAPNYAPELWIGTQETQNCYDYALDDQFGERLDPGVRTNYFIMDITCEEVVNGASSDGLSTCSHFANELSEGEGYYVALAIWDDSPDYHWYRQDSSGYWSHKIGSREPTRFDNRGRLILNPEICDRGPYSSFCCFMICPTTTHSTTK